MFSLLYISATYLQIYNHEVLRVWCFGLVWVFFMRRARMSFSHAFLLAKLYFGLFCL